VLTGHTSSVTAIEVLEEGGTLLSASLDGSLRFWDYVTGVQLHRWGCMGLVMDVSVHG
jgi:WD40 repeat protein